MRLKAAALALSLGLAFGPVAAHAQSQALNLQNADIRVFVQDVARASGRTLIVDPRVQGTVTVVSDRPLSRDQLFELMQTTLRANGLVVIPAGPNTFRIAPEEGAASAPAGFATRLFFLKTLDAADAAQTLRPLIGKSGVALAAPGNVLIVVDYADNVGRIAGLIDQIDQDRTELTTVELQNSTAREVIEAAGPLISPPSAGGAARPAPRLALAAAPGGRAIVLRGDPVLVAQAQAIIRELDAREPSNAEVQVVRLENASAKDLLPVLQQMIGQAPQQSGPAAAGAAPAPAAIRSGPRSPSVALFEGGNALVISADPKTQAELAGVIRQLDVRRQQVLVTAIVVEISDTLAQNLGVQFGLGGGSGGVVTNFPAGSPSLMGVISAAAGQNNLTPGSAAQAALTTNAVNSINTTPGLVGGVGGRAGDVVIGAIINAVKSDSASNLLSTPSIVTLDNKEANLSVGQEISVTTGEVLSASNSNPFRTVERRDVGVQLRVTPQINAGGGITLAIKQEVSSVAAQAAGATTDPIFNKREFETNVMVDDGDIVVLGGLLDQSDTTGADKVPGLGDLPGIGGLFRSSSTNRTRRNLMVFIRPTILKSARDAEVLAAQRYEYMRADEAAARPDAKSALEAAVRDYLKAQPPAP